MVSCSNNQLFSSSQLTGQVTGPRISWADSGLITLIKWSIGRNIPITDNGSITGHVVAIIGLSILYVGLTFCFQEQHYCVKVEPCTFYQNNWQRISGQSAIFPLRCPVCISDALFTLCQPTITSANGDDCSTPRIYFKLKVLL